MYFHLNIKHLRDFISLKFVVQRFAIGIEITLKFSFLDEFVTQQIFLTADQHDSAYFLVSAHVTQIIRKIEI
jgi:hypothetical protein